MAVAKCRCGQLLPAASGDSGRVICPRCGARVRVRPGASPESPDGFLRFYCPCGRRLKVSASEPPRFGRCPNCRRVVPVPERSASSRLPAGHPETPTEEMNQVDLTVLDRWSLEHRTRSGGAPTERGTTTADVAPALEGRAFQVRAEAGLRVCPRCARPVHLGSDQCDECGIAVPRR
jgi:hypothetical protein